MIYFKNTDCVCRWERTASESCCVGFFSYWHWGRSCSEQADTSSFTRLGWICVQIYPMELKDHAWTFLPSSYTTLLHQKWGFHIYVCLCRNSSSSVVTFSMPSCKPKMKFFVFTFATSCLFSVLFSAEETAMLMLETEDLCFQNIQDWQSASNGELVCCCFFCGCRPCGHIPATLHLCSVSKRTGPHAIWSFQES